MNGTGGGCPHRDHEVTSDRGRAGDVARGGINDQTGRQSGCGKGVGTTVVGGNPVQGPCASGVGLGLESLSSQHRIVDTQHGDRNGLENASRRRGVHDRQAEGVGTCVTCHRAVAQVVGHGSGTSHLRG